MITFAGIAHIFTPYVQGEGALIARLVRTSSVTIFMTSHKITSVKALSPDRVTLVADIFIQLTTV